MTDEERRRAIIPDAELKTIIDWIKTHQKESGLLDKDWVKENQDKLRRFGQHTIEISYRMREKAMDTEGVPFAVPGVPKFDREYEKQFRELDNIQLEAMILAHETLIHQRRPNTIRVIRDALMNKIIMEEEQVNNLPEGSNIEEVKNLLAQSNLTITQLEKAAISAELEKTKGNFAQAAKNLGIGRATIYRKIKEYGLTR